MSAFGVSWQGLEDCADEPLVYIFTLFDHQKKKIYSIRKEFYRENEDLVRVPIEEVEIAC